MNSARLTQTDGHLISLTVRDLKNYQIFLFARSYSGPVEFLSSKIVLWDDVLLLKFQILTVGIVEIISLTIL